jgi:hypothetical protein
MNADVLGCINIQRQATFNASHLALEASCQSRDSRAHINEILVSNDPAPPTIIFRNSVELREIEGDGFDERVCSN